MAFAEEVAVRLGFDATELRRGAQRAKASIDTFARSINQLRQNMQRLTTGGIRALRVGLRGIGNVAGRAFSAIRTGALAATAAIAGLTASLVQTARQLERIGQISSITGVSSTFLQGFQNFIGLAGLEPEQGRQVLVEFNKRVAEFQNRFREAAAETTVEARQSAFDALTSDPLIQRALGGLRIRQPELRKEVIRRLFGVDLDADSIEDAILDQDVEGAVRLALDLLQQEGLSQTDRTLAAQGIFGEEGGAGVLALGGGSAALEDTIQRGLRTGAIASDAAVSLATEVQESITLLGQSIRGVRNTLFELTGLDLRQLIDDLSELISQNRARIAESLGKALKFVFDQISDIVRVLSGQEAQTALGRFAEAFIDTAQALREIRGGADIGGIAVSPNAERNAAAINRAQSINDFITSITPALSDLRNGVLDLVPTLDQLSSAITQASNGILRAVEFLPGVQTSRERVRVAERAFIDQAGINAVREARQSRPFGLLGAFSELNIRREAEANARQRLRDNRSSSLPVLGRLYVNDTPIVTTRQSASDLTQTLNRAGRVSTTRPPRGR